MSLRLSAVCPTSLAPLLAHQLQVVFTACEIHTGVSFNVFPGLEEKLDLLNQLKVKGLVLGPFHTVQADKPMTLDFTTIDPTHGREETFLSVLGKAHKKGELFNTLLHFD